MFNWTDLWSPIRLSLELATITTVLLLIIGTPIAWWLARSRVWWREAVAAIVAMPLVLPPTVLGFYLLLAFGPHGPGGVIASLFGARTLAFTFTGLMIASVLYSMPFVVQPIRNAFEAAIYDFVETQRWAEAHFLAAGLVVFAFAVITAMMVLEKRIGRSGS